MAVANHFAATVQRRQYLVGNGEYQRSSSGYRSCPACSVFCCRCGFAPCGSFTDVKKPEHALKLLSACHCQGVITYGLELMLALFDIVQGTISTIMTSAGFGTPNQTTLPAEMVTTIESCGFLKVSHCGRLLLSADCLSRSCRSL